MGQRVSDRGPLIWGRWNGCAEGVERAQWVSGARDVAWGCWWLCRAGGIKAGRSFGQVTFLAFQASRIRSFCREVRGSRIWPIDCGEVMSVFPWTPYV